MRSLNSKYAIQKAVHEFYKYNQAPDIKCLMKKYNIDSEYLLMKQITFYRKNKFSNSVFFLDKELSVLLQSSDSLEIMNI